MTNSNKSIENQLKDENSEASRLLKDLSNSLSDNYWGFVGEISVSEKFSSSKTFMREAILIDPDFLMYASDELKKDPELLLTVEESELLRKIVENSNYATSHAKENNHPLKSCPKKFISNKSFMTDAIKRDPNSLMYASDAFKKDPKLQLAAEESRLLVELWLFNRKSSHYRMHNDEKHPLKNCPKRFTSNKSFMRDAIRVDVYNLRFANDKLKKDQDLLLAAVKENPFYYQEIPEELIKDKKLFYNTAKDHMLKLLGSDEDFPQFKGFFSDYWIRDGEYIIFGAFSNDMDFASEIFDYIYDCPNRYFEFFDFLGPMLLENNEHMEFFYTRMAKYISRSHKGSLDILDIQGGGYDLSDEEINNHLSGIKIHMKEYVSYEKKYN